MDLNWIAQTMILLGLGIIGFFLQDLKKSVEKEIQNNKSEIKAVRCDLDNKISKVNEDTDNKINKVNDDINKVNDDINEKICKVDEKLDKFKEHVNRNFVDKESYIRNITAFDAKLDKITDLIMEMKGERKRE